MIALPGRDLRGEEQAAHPSVQLEQDRRVVLEPSPLHDRAEIGDTREQPRRSTLWAL